jgi:hypothetical protein
MVVSLNQRRRGGYLTATIQIPSWLPSWPHYTKAAPYQNGWKSEKQNAVSHFKTIELRFPLFDKPFIDRSLNGLGLPDLAKIPGLYQHSRRTL